MSLLRILSNLPHFSAIHPAPHWRTAKTISKPGAAIYLVKAAILALWKSNVHCSISTTCAEK